MIEIFSKKDQPYEDGLYKSDKWGVWDKLDECRRYDTQIRNEAKDLFLNTLFFVSVIIACLYLLGLDSLDYVYDAIVITGLCAISYFFGGRSVLERYKKHLDQENRSE